MRRVWVWVAVAIVVGVAGWAGWCLLRPPASPRAIIVHAKGPSPNDRLRQSLFAELQPVALTNCELKRFGEANDGGYVLCGNLLGSVQAGYSYGISGYDGWGCQVSRELKIRVHQYDCFDLHQPVCPGGATTFHPECVAGKPSTDESGRIFETLEKQIAKTGNGGGISLSKWTWKGPSGTRSLRLPMPFSSK
jgi:hypothetical protein